jgi:hypothetical protein
VIRSDAKAMSQEVLEAFLDGNDTLVVQLHNEANEDYDFYLECWSQLPSYVRARIKEIVANYDPTPWCHQCGARRQSDCHCGPIADND